MKKARIVVSLVSCGSLAALVLGAGLFHHPHARSPEARAAAASAEAPRARLEWKRGEAYVYRFVWDNETTMRAPALAPSGATEIKGAAAFEGELALRCFGLRDGAYLFAARASALSKHRVELFGKDALADESTTRATFEGRDAFVAIEPNGAVRTIYVAPDAPPIFGHTMRALLAQLHVTVNDGRAWTAAEPGPAGKAQVAWAVTAPLTFVRVRDKYDTLSALPAPLAGEHDDALDSRSSMTLAPEGFVQSLRDSETLLVRAKNDTSQLLLENARFSLEHLRTERFDAGDFDPRGLQASHPGDSEQPFADAETQKLTQLAADMSVKKITSQLFMVGIGQTVGSDFLVRAMALLRLHPELSDEVLRLASDRNMPPKGRELAADLLAAAGHEQAQTALRALLASPAVRADKTLERHILQRLGFVQAPKPETVQAVRSAYAHATAKGDEDGRLAAAYTLGSTAARLAAHGDDAPARAIADGLARDLASTKDGADRRGLIAALGNAASESTLPALRASAADGDPSVRAEVAHALRRLETPESREMLHGMVADTDGQVARSAIDSLAQQTVGEDDVRRITGLVEHGEIPRAAIPALLTLLSKHTSPADAVAAALRALAARAPGDSDLQSRIEAILEQLH